MRLSWLPMRSLTATKRQKAPLYAEREYARLRAAGRFNAELLDYLRPFVVPGITTVGSGYSFLQKWLPNVAQAAVREGMTDLVGIARMHIAYPRFIFDVMRGSSLDTSAIEAAF